MLSNLVSSLSLLCCVTEAHSKQPRKAVIHRAVKDERMWSGDEAVGWVDWFPLRDVSSSVASDLVRPRRFATD